MVIVNLAQAKARLSELLDKVEGGEDVVITRHGRPSPTLPQSQSRNNRFGRWPSFAPKCRAGEGRAQPCWANSATRGFDALFRYQLPRAAHP